MKKIFKIFFTVLLTLSISEAIGQNFAQYLQQRDYQREFYSNYSRWSLGAYAGPSAVWGDMKSFAYDKTYIGVTAGINAGYQITPTVGLNLSAGYLYNKAGAKSGLEGMMIGSDGNAIFGSMIPENSAKLGSLYSEINSMQFALNTEINIANVFKGNNGNYDRRWTFLASPGLYLQYFKPFVYSSSTGNRFVMRNVHYGWAFGYGGDLTARYKVSPLVDLEVKGGATWITNNKFDGIETATTRHLNGVGYVQVGVRFKLGNKKKTDHLSYAPTGRYVRKTFEVPVREIVKVETDCGNKPAEVIEKVVYKTPEELPEMPTVHFVRGSAELDTRLYAEELQEIVSTLKLYPDITFEIWGYADHTGTDNINSKLTLERAEALKQFLVNAGIPANRIVKLRAMGKDIKLEGESALSIVARRAQIVD